LKTQSIEPKSRGATPVFGGGVSWPSKVGDRPGSDRDRLTENIMDTSPRIYSWKTKAKHPYKPLALETCPARTALRQAQEPLVEVSLAEVSLSLA